MILRESEIVVDLFAGGGGTSEGIKAATGRDPDIAINHDPLAVEMHKANHPLTTHYCESVFKVRPLDATRGRLVGLVLGACACSRSWQWSHHPGGIKRAVARMRVGDAMAKRAERWVG